MAVLALALIFSPLRARAAEFAGVALTAERTAAAEDCPSADTLAMATLALGSAPEVPSGSLELVVRFDHDVEGYVARIEARGRKQGTRELRTTAPSCRSLADAVVVVLAVLSDLTPRRAAVAAPPSAAPLPPQNRPKREASLALGAESGIAYGLLGSAASGTVSVALRGRYRAFGVELGGLWGLPHFESLAPGVLQVGLLGGTALGCAWLGENTRPEFGVCAGVGIGVLSGSGHGYDNDGAATLTWLTALGGLAVRLPFNQRWAVGASLFALVPLRSQSFVVAPLGAGFSSAPAAVLLRFGPEYRFW
jgi:hypothetical protein